MDTSKAMRPKASTVQKTVSNLLQSGMHAQLQRGDTIGVWTYNEQLYAGRLPLQQWSPEDEQTVASNIVAFVKAQSYEKTSRFDTVWPALQSVVGESEKLTVLLISDGDENISGTPFDREINAFFKENSRSQTQKRMPFVTVLRSYRGKIISVTLNLAPWPAEFSPFPPAPKVAAAPKPKPPTENIAPPPTAPPLIVIGKKPEPAHVTPPVPAEPTLTKPVEPSEGLPAPVTELKSLPTPIVPATTPTVTATEATPIAATAQPKPDVLPVAAQTTGPVVERKPSAVELPQSVSEQIVTTPETQPVPPPAVPQPVIATPTEISHASTPVLVNPKPPQPATTEQQPPATAAGQLATATQPEKGFNPKHLLIIGVVVVVALIILLRSRARAASHASLITRSMDQDKK